MKKTFAILTALSVIFASRAQKTPNDPALKMLREFYTAYIREVATDSSPNFVRRIDSIQRRYCTAGVINNIKGLRASGSLDWDPFLKAQDANIEDIKTLEFGADQKNKSLYTVAYTDASDGKRITIKLLIIRKKTVIKIASVFLDTPGLPKNI